MELKYAVAKAKALRPNNSVDDQYLIDAVNEVEREIGTHLMRHEIFADPDSWSYTTLDNIPQYAVEDLGELAESKTMMLSDHIMEIDGETRLVFAWEQYSMAYVWRLCAEIDQILGEFDRYNNDAGKYEELLQEWKAYVRRTYRPLQDHREGWKVF